MRRLGLALVTGSLFWAQPPQAGLVLEGVSVNRKSPDGRSLDTEAMVEHAREVLESDFETWRGYEFLRHVERQKLDKSGSVVWRAEYVLRVHPTREGFDEILTQINDREPTPGEIGEHYQADRFERHYKSAGSLDNPFGRPIPLLPLLFKQQHQYIGRRVIRGHPCIKTSFSEREPPPQIPTRQRLEYAIRGEACFSIPGDHLVMADMETARPVSAGVVKVHELQIGLEGQAVGGGHWLPTRFEVRADIRLGFKRLRKWNRYRYTDFHFIGPRTE